MSSKIKTYTGKLVDPFALTLEDICIKDIAHSLSNLCRFNGHGKRFYSVAEHCVESSNWVIRGGELESLMHDACEAYIGDIPYPIKSRLPLLAAQENYIKLLIGEKYGIDFVTADVDDVDKTIVYYEAFNLGLNPDDWSVVNKKQRSNRMKSVWKEFEDTPDINFWSPEVAEKKFLERFYELVTIKNGW